MAFDARQHRRFLRRLGIVFAVVWTWLAIAPTDREVWWLENMLTFVGVGMMAVSYFRMPLSRVSYACVFVFGVLHAIGAHHTYSLTPYDAWTQSYLGVSIDRAFGFERNHYDRFVHLCWGLLLTYPAREMLVRLARLRGFWGYALPMALIMATSVLYETIEWLAAVTFGGDLGVQYLGTQGDEWDGNKDMALASAGALAVMAATACVNAVLQPDFRREWSESVSARGSEPRGEVTLARLWRARRRAS